MIKQWKFIEPFYMETDISAMVVFVWKQSVSYWALGSIVKIS